MAISKVGAGCAIVVGCVLAACGAKSDRPPLYNEDRVEDASVVDAAEPGDSAVPRGDASDASDAIIDAPRDSGDSSVPPVGDCKVTGTPAPSGSCQASAVSCAAIVEQPPSTARFTAACSAEQLNRYYEACHLDPARCPAFKQDPANAACLGCLITPESASRWGPLVQDGHGALSVNVVGCRNGYGPGCQDSIHTADACERAACDASCPGSADDPTWRTRYAACREAAATTSCASISARAAGCREAAKFEPCMTGIDFASEFYAVAPEFCVDSRICTAEPLAGLVDLWYPPPALHRNQCSAAQIDDYLLACNRDGGAPPQACADFQTANAGCYQCAVTADSSATWGPLVRSETRHTMMLNTAGCVAGALGQQDGTGCSRALMQKQRCDYFACSGQNCSYGIMPFGECAKAAEYGGCGRYVAEARACETQARQAGGDAAECLNFSDALGGIRKLATLFCGP